MNKNSSVGGMLYHSLKKTLLIMRIATILLLVGFLQTQANDAYSQKTKLSISFSNTELAKVLDRIENQSEFYFLYNEKLIDATRKVSIEAKDERIEEVLKNLFSGTDVEYSIIDRKIILAPTYLSGSQQSGKKITGKVTDSSGATLPGVSVVIKGTTTGVTTDIDGKFSMRVPDNAQTLVVSFVGMTTQEIAIGTKSTFAITLIEQAVGVDEVVVVGYGTQKRRDVIGSVATVKSADIVSTRAFTLEGALQGRASGLQITPSNGNPGAQLKVLIRGLSTISSNSDPLWVVDGAPIGDVANINPNDIASIEVLKDAGATAIYGSRGANGVIMVTTKTAAPNKKSTSINYSTGISEMSRTAEDMGIANTSQWFQLLDMGTANVGAAKFTGSLTTLTDHLLGTTKGYKPLTRSQAEVIDNKPDDFFRKGSFQDLNVSTALGFEKASMFFSLNYRNDKGLEKGNSMDRLSFRMNLNYEPVKNVKIGSRVNLSYFRNNVGANQFSSVMTQRQSWYPIYDSTDPTGYWNPYSVNAANEMRTSSLYVDNTTNKYRALVSNFIQYDMPFIKGLSIRADVNIDQSFSDGINWNSDQIRVLGTASDVEYSNRGTNLLMNSYLTYNRDFGDHNITFTAGAERQTNKGYSYGLAGEDLSSPFHELGSMPAVKNSMSAGVNAERYIGSYFSRIGYHYKNKYLVEGSLRRDGSSAFSASNRYSVFPAVAIGWVLTDESFFKPISSVVNLAKFRGSVGQTGNQSIPNGVSLLTWATSGNYGGTLYQGTSGSVPTSIPNQAATWETTTSYDGGLDFGLFKNRITGSLAYYLKDVNGLLLALNVPSSSGSKNSVIWKNIGRMVTKGIEVDLQSVNFDKNGFRWSSTFNFTSTRNNVKSISPDIDASGAGIAQSGGGLVGTLSTYLKTGDPVGEYYMAEAAGVDPQNGYPRIWELNQATFLATHQTVRTGNMIPATVTNLRNNKFIENNKTGLPTYFGSLGNTFEYKGFDLSLLFTYAGGNYLYNDMNVAMTQTGLFWGPVSNKLLTEAWTKPGDIAKYGQVRYGGNYNFDDAGKPVTIGSTWGETQDASTRYLEKGDFIRLKNLQFGYNLSKQICSNIGVNNIRVYFSATNLLTFTSYTGWDPEIVRIDKSTDRATNMLSGYTGIAMPNYKTYSFGISLGF